MNTRLWVIAAILGMALAITEFIKQVYPRLEDGSRELLTSVRANYWRFLADAERFWAEHKQAVILAAGVIVLLRIVLALWRLHIRTIAIASNFDVAEADLNGMIKSFRAHKGRLSRTKERADWYANIAKKEPPLFNFGDPFPSTISDRLIETNESEVQSKRKKQSDCIMTAFLLAQLYRAAPEAARAKIEVERQLGNSPYVAPGIDFLINENWRLLRYVVHTRGFPRGLVLKEGDAHIYNWDVIKALIQE